MPRTATRASAEQSGDEHRATVLTVQKENPSPLSWSAQTGYAIGSSRAAHGDAASSSEQRGQNRPHRRGHHLVTRNSGMPVKRIRRD